MAGTPGYMREVCVRFTTGDEIQYHFESEHAVNFYIHYRTEKEIRFKERKESVKKLTGEFASDVSQAHCFVWRNKYVNNNKWKITLHFQVARKQ